MKNTIQGDYLNSFNNMSKKKVLLLTGDLAHYRVPVYEILNKKHALTIGYLRKDFSDNQVSFNKIKLKSYSFASLVFNGYSLFRLCSKFDVVIVTMDLHYISFALLPLLFKFSKIKIISWSIGIRASYKHKFDLNRKKTILDYIFYKINSLCDAVITYTKEAIDFYEDYNINKNKYFVAHNTVAVNLKSEPVTEKEILLFVGTLYKEKGVDELIRSYERAYLFSNSIPKLYIIGDGPEYSSVKEYIDERRLSDSIVLCGKIMDEGVLHDYFVKSIICISPNQAGLSVLKSLGYGVPFVTKPNAITGGELLNVISDYNGILYKDETELTQIILRTSTDKVYFANLGHNAYTYYNQNATPQIMANGVLEAIDYALKK